MNLNFDLMIALPSIAFGGFYGSAKGVTARHVGGRSILSVKSWPTGMTTSAQVARRASMSKITKSYKLLSDAQMMAWENLAEHTSGQSVFGQKAQLSGINLYVRLNANRAMAGESLISDAPDYVVAVPNVSYTDVVVTPQLVVFGGIKHESSPIEGRLKYAAEQIQGGQYQIFYDFNLELIPSPAMAACEGRTGIYSAGPVTFSAPDCPEEILPFDAYFLAVHQQSNALTVQLLDVQIRKSGSDATVNVTDLSGDGNLAFKMFDTAVAMRTS